MVSLTPSGLARPSAVTDALDLVTRMQADNDADQRRRFVDDIHRAATVYEENHFQDWRADASNQEFADPFIDPVERLVGSMPSGAGSSLDAVLQAQPQLAPTGEGEADRLAHDTLRFEPRGELAGEVIDQAAVAGPLSRPKPPWLSRPEVDPEGNDGRDLSVPKAGAGGGENSIVQLAGTYTRALSARPEASISAGASLGQETGIAATLVDALPRAPLESSTETSANTPTSFALSASDLGRGQALQSLGEVGIEAMVGRPAGVPPRGGDGLGDDSIARLAAAYARALPARPQAFESAGARQGPEAGIAQALVDTFAPAPLGSPTETSDSTPSRLTDGPSDLGERQRSRSLRAAYDRIGDEGMISSDLVNLWGVGPSAFGSIFGGANATIGDNDEHARQSEAPVSFSRVGPGRRGR